MPDTLRTDRRATHDGRSRFVAALIAGGIAIAVNSLALKAADLVPLATAHGGLLRLIRPLLPSILAAKTASAWFQTGFHIAVGLTMAVAYAYLVEPVFRAPPWAKGMICAAFLWLLNAAVVLPITGEGFAGSSRLDTAGILWFAAAHTMFFVGTAVLFAWVRSETTGGRNAR